MKKIFVYSILILSIGCKCGDEKKQPEPEPQKPLTQSKNSEAFNKGFTNILNNYYALHTAFVKEDTAAIASSSTALKTAIDSFPIKEFKADSTVALTVQDMALTILADVEGLIGEKDINEKRKNFDMLSKNLISLVQASKYDATKVYKLHCPMAFDNAGADWISNNKQEIINPYLPKEMPNCGEVEQGINAE